MKHITELRLLLGVRHFKLQSQRWPYSNIVRHVAILLVLSLIISLSARAQSLAVPSESFCGQIQNAYGPFDYRKNPDRLPIVEQHHFTPAVEALIRGQEGYIGGDLDYILRAYPNHPRALVSMMRYAEKSKQDPPPHMRYTVECWFERAIRFARDDVVVRMLYAQFLKNKNRISDAKDQLMVVLNYAGDNPFTHYNAGLIFFELGLYDQALQRAHTALALGLTRTELREALARVGKWVDPTPPSADKLTEGAAGVVAPVSASSSSANTAAKPKE
jgi:hypothetical protein